MTAYLTRDEVVQQTGRRRAAAQCRALDKRGIPYVLDADGWPQVLRANLERAHGVTGARPPAGRQEPDFSWIGG